MTVPRTAFFYWTGPAHEGMPWLREQTLVSFRRHHPGWEVVLGTPEARYASPGIRVVRDTITDPALPPAARSDAWRWQMLAEHGGVYSDMDVIFVRPIDAIFAGEHDAWLTQDLGTPVLPLGFRRDAKRRPLRDAAGHVVWNVALSIGVLGAARGSRFFGRVARFARAHAHSDDYQSHGTRLLVAHWRELSAGLSLGAVPARAFYREGSADETVRRLWTETVPPPPDELGLHWYGGSVESAPFLGARGLEDLPPCSVRQALEA